MKSNHRHRPLGFEQLEQKAAPSSVLLVLPMGAADAMLPDGTANPVLIHSSAAKQHQYGTEQLLRFIEENTTSNERVNRPATPPTAAECEAADEMMSRVATTQNGLLILSF
ncbi:MAG: hypothetical protein H8E66_28185 [Planctomycetes bacterium]|nr:hypothetical protein [Planctomycetota bacterium]